MVKLLVAHGANRQLRNEVSVTEVMRLCVNGLVYCMVTNTLIVVMTHDGDCVQVEPCFVISKFYKYRIICDHAL